MPNVRGPEEAFFINDAKTPKVYALQHHLVLEVIAHLQAETVPFVFRGGTALHTKLKQRTRFSIDADITTPDPEAVADALRQFAAQHRHSDVRLEDPPDEMKVDGARHTLRFGRIKTNQGDDLRILVEVVKASETPGGTEALPLDVGGLNWEIEVAAPTLAAFAGQKLAVLGPTTVGKPIGIAEKTNPRVRQGVCKQIFDLRTLLQESLEVDQIHAAYLAAVHEANELRGTTFDAEACLNDAQALLQFLKDVRGTDRAQRTQYALWKGYGESRRWFPPERRWTEPDYRVSAGVISRLAEVLRQREFAVPFSMIVAPLVASDIPAATREKLNDASDEDWWLEDFAANLRVAWAWAPRDLW